MGFAAISHEVPPRVCCVADDDCTASPNCEPPASTGEKSQEQPVSFRRGGSGKGRETGTKRITNCSLYMNEMTKPTNQNLTNPAASFEMRLEHKGRQAVVPMVYDEEFETHLLVADELPRAFTELGIDADAAVPEDYDPETDEDAYATFDRDVTYGLCEGWAANRYCLPPAEEWGDQTPPEDSLIRWQTVEK